MFGRDVSRTMTLSLLASADSTGWRVLASASASVDNTKWGVPTSGIETKDRADGGVSELVTMSGALRAGNQSVGGRGSDETEFLSGVRPHVFLQC